MASTNRGVRRLALFSALIVGTTILTAPTALAAGPGGVGRIAYSSGGHLFVMNSDGSNPVDITPSGCNSAYEPDWAPDGSVIAFITECNGPWDVATIRPDGTGYGQLVPSTGDEVRPAFSPDGTKIAYNSGYNSAGTFDLLVANADGSNPVDVTNRPGTEDFPSWSPDSQRIVYAGGVSGYDLFVMDADGSNVRQITTGGSDKWPSWSPDGSRILFTRGPSDTQGDLYWIRPDGTHLTRLTTDGTSAIGDWSADGSQIVCGSGADLSIMNADGTGKTSIGSGTEPDWDPSSGPAGASLWFQLPAQGQTSHPLQLTGGLTIPGASAAGESLDVHATPPGGTRQSLGTVTTTAGGAFTFSTTPDAVGRWTYEVSWGGDAGHDPVTYQSSIQVTLPVPKLRLLPTKGTMTFGTSQWLTASLTDGPRHAQVSIYAQKSGTSRKQVIKRGRIDAHGRLRVQISPSSNTDYTARFAGGGGWAATSASARHVDVRAVWAAESIHAYGRSGRYHLYHYTTTCQPPKYAGCPWSRFTLRPAHPNEKCTFVFQYKWHGRWQTWTHAWRLTSRSLLYTVTSYTSTKIIGVPHRVRADFGGDSDHVGAASPWVYWKITR